ncbi:uncharacterized protein [Antedon mediterranea]|uniref:uncharacterized protein n=1 Tax=Antedon mediterranea TaxID=105859 RepID=UPI003AF5C4D1
MNTCLLWIYITICVKISSINGSILKPFNSTKRPNIQESTIVPWSFSSVSFHGLVAVAVVSSDSHNVEYYSGDSAPTYISRVITDGNILVKTLHNSYRRLRHCHIEYNASFATEVLRKIRFVFHDQYVRDYVFSSQSSYGEIGNLSNIVNDCEDFISRKNTGINSLSRYSPIAYLFIVPGTKWCGISNKADHYEDLGEYPDEDVCCRDHDYCKISIHSFDYGYGYYNLDVKTISHCDCDREFFSCLRLINSPKAQMVLGIYQFFQKNCFDVEEKFRCVEWNWGLCVKEDTVPTAIIRSDVR